MTFNMDGFRVFKYYTAIKLHFTTSSFDVFVNRGRVRGSHDTFLGRNDHYIYEKLGRQFKSEQECIQYIAANFMYDNPDLIYNPQEAEANYTEYLRRKQSITRIFTDDLDTIIKSGAQYEFSGLKIPDVLQLYMAKRITLETLVILNSFDNIVDKMKQSSQMYLLLGDELQRIEKSAGFVKFDSNKVLDPYSEFTKEVTSGQDLSAIT